ncbi:MAG: hypothetical protein PHP32_06785 [Candidatus Izemoplasmatales bacterium]|nr:hypothetical protein [Candidatus Izemoplasmatales bacterium]
MKRLFFAFSFLALLFTLGACSSLNTTTSLVTFETDTEVFALEALGASSLLVQEEAQTLALAQSTTTVGDDPEIASSIDDIAPYLQMMEAYLGSDTLLDQTVEASTNPDYTYMVTIESVTLDGTATSFVLYYNEVFYESDTTDDTTDDQTNTTTTTTEPEVTESETTDSTDTEPLAGEMTQERDFFFEDATDDDAVTYYLEGLLVVDEVSYNIEGKLISLGDAEVLRLYSYIDHDNYVRAEYKLDGDDERKFFFRVVEEGVITRESKIKIEEDETSTNVLMNLVEGTKELNLHFVLDTDEDTTIIKLMYTVTEDGEVIDDGHIKIYRSVDAETGEIIYDYKVLSNHKSQTYQYQTRTHVFGGSQADTNTDDASL